MTSEKQRAQPIFDTFSEASSELDRCAVSISEASNLISRLKPFDYSFYYAKGEIGKVWVPLSTEAKEHLDVIGVEGLFKEWRDTAVKRGKNTMSSMYRGVSWRSSRQKWRAKYQAKVPGQFSRRGGGRTSLRLGSVDRRGRVSTEDLVSYHLKDWH